MSPTLGFSTGSFPRPRPLGSTAHRSAYRLQRSSCGYVMHPVSRILHRPTGSNPAFAFIGLPLSPFREVFATGRFGFGHWEIPEDRVIQLSSFGVPVRLRVVPLPFLLFHLAGTDLYLNAIYNSPFNFSSTFLFLFMFLIFTFPHSLC